MSEHECDATPDYFVIRNRKPESWVLVYIDPLNEACDEIVDINYCPYCGVELEGEE